MGAERRSLRGGVATPVRYGCAPSTLSRTSVRPCSSFGRSTTQPGSSNGTGSRHLRPCGRTSFHPRYWPRSMQSGVSLIEGGTLRTTREFATSPRILPPGCTGREGVLRQRRRLQLRAVSGVRGRHVAAVADHHRVHEVLVQVINVLKDAVVQGGGNRNVVEDR